MLKLYIYLETLILGTLFLIFSKLKNALTIIGNTAEWYTMNKVHFYQVRKVQQIFYAQKMEEHDLIAEIKKLKEELDKLDKEIT